MKTEKELREKFDKKIRNAVQFESPFTCEGVCAEITQEAISETKRIYFGQSSDGYIQAAGWWRRQLEGLGRLLKS